MYIMDYRQILKETRKDESLKSDLNIDEIVKDMNLQIDLDTLIQEKIDVLKTLEITTKDAKEMLEKLECYRYIDDIYKFERGRFVRWINAKNKLMSGAICVDIAFTSTGTNIVCKNNNGSRIFQLKFDNNHFFQLLTEDEQMVLAVNEKIQLT